MSWSVDFYYSNGDSFNVNSINYNDDITFLQLKQILVSSDFSRIFMFNKTDINDNLEIKIYNNEIINIAKIPKIYNNIISLIDGDSSIDINNKNIIKIINTSHDVYVAITLNGDVLSWYYNDNHHLNNAFNYVKDKLINIIDETAPRKKWF